LLKGLSSRAFAPRKIQRKNGCNSQREKPDHRHRQQRAVSVRRFLCCVLHGQCSFQPHGEGAIGHTQLRNTLGALRWRKGRDLVQQLMQGQSRVRRIHASIPLENMRKMTQRGERATSLYNGQMQIDIIFQDEHLVVVNKPAGLLAHASRMASDVDEDLQDLLKQQLGGSIHLVHRLDRATSGLILAARSSHVAGLLGQQFMQRSVHKTYLGVVRGWPAESGEIDYALPDVRENSPRKPALTSFRRLATATVPIALGKYAEQRYALIEASPHTGRYRQIRKHLHHISHHLIGDTSHGRTEHNRLFKAEFGVQQLLLHAHQLTFDHPIDARRMRLIAPLDGVWQGLLQRLDWQQWVPDTTCLSSVVPTSQPA
jgi:tRNA pseudouridine65 synthase